MKYDDQNVRVQTWDTAGQDRFLGNLNRVCLLEMVIFMKYFVNI